MGPAFDMGQLRKMLKQFEKGAGGGGNNRGDNEDFERGARPSRVSPATGAGRR